MRVSLLNTDQISSALPVTPYKNKSTITLYLISDDTQGEANQFFNSLDDIKNAFKINYSEVNFGLPIFCKGYYTKDNSVFTLKKQYITLFITNAHLVTSPNPNTASRIPPDTPSDPGNKQKISEQKRDR